MNSHKYSEIERQICREISVFCYNREQQNAVEADKLLSLFGITDVTYEENTIHITLTRPGMIIGKRGECIHALKEWLKTQINPDIQINLIENTIIYHFMSWQRIENDYLIDDDNDNW